MGPEGPYLVPKGLVQEGPVGCKIARAHSGTLGSLLFYNQITTEGCSRQKEREATQGPRAQQELHSHPGGIAAALGTLSSYRRE